jgi:hypothetical protein
MSEPEFKWQITGPPYIIDRTEFVCEVYKHTKFRKYSVDTFITAIQLGDIYGEYSEELIFSTIILSSKYLEDHYYGTKKGCSQVDNFLVCKIEWEIFRKVNFTVVNFNWLTIYYKFSSSKIVDEEIWTISKKICLNKILMYCNQYTLALAIKLLKNM